MNQSFYDYKIGDVGDTDYPWYNLNYYSFFRWLNNVLFPRDPDVRILERKFSSYYSYKNDDWASQIAEKYISEDKKGTFVTVSMSMLPPDSLDAPLEFAHYIQYQLDKLTDSVFIMEEQKNGGNNKKTKTVTPYQSKSIINQPPFLVGEEKTKLIKISDILEVDIASEDAQTNEAKDTGMGELAKMVCFFYFFNFFYQKKQKNYYYFK